MDHNSSEREALEDGPDVLDEDIESSSGGDAAHTGGRRRKRFGSLYAIIQKGVKEVSGGPLVAPTSEPSHACVAHDLLKDDGYVVDDYALHVISEVPDWLHDNDFILTGYRVRFSIWLCLKSIFRLHNETMNIWTHLLGFALFVGAMGFANTIMMPLDDLTVSWADRLIVSIFIASAALCLLFSTLFHTFFCHSHNTLKVFGRLDYTGISVLIGGSFYPAIFYGFYCQPFWQIAYLITISTFAIATIVVSLIPKFEKPQFRVFRASLFAGLGLFGVIPCFHRMGIYGIFSPEVTRTVPLLALMGALYLVGAVIYSMRIPERWFPGRFDYFLSSHQIFHCLVVAAACVHYYFVHRCFHDRKLEPCFRAPPAHLPASLN
eukprot:tig00000367_g24447.t1